MVLKHRRRWREYRFLIGVAALALAYGVLSQTALLQGTHPLVGHKAPDFRVERLKGGFIEPFQHRGKEVVVLDFWSTNCPPCRKGLPLVARVVRAFSGRPVVAYGISIMDPPDHIRAFLRETGVELPIGVDAFGDLADLYGVQGIPHTVVIGMDGTVRAVHVGVGGFERWLRDAVQEALDASSLP